MADYKISLEAQNDLQQAYIYGVERYGVPAADDFYDALYACFDVIASSPRTWPRVDHVKQGYRRYIYRKGRGRTSIYYRIVGDIVEIMAGLGWAGMKWPLHIGRRARVSPRPFLCLMACCLRI